MKNIIAGVRRWAVAHKILSGIMLIAIAGGGYYWYSSTRSTTSVTTYVLQNATKGTIVSAVTGSGQVQAVTSIDIKPQVTEDVTKIYVKVGDHVKQGQILVQLDSSNEQKALNQAELSLQSAQLNLEQLQQISTTTLLSNQQAVTKAVQALATASTTLVADYQNGFDTLSAAFVNLQTVMTGLQNFVQGNDINKVQQDPDAYVSIMPSYLQGATQPYRDAVVQSFTSAYATYQTNLNDYRKANRNADHATLDALFSETYSTTQAVSTAVKAASDLINFVLNSYPKGGGLAPLPSITNTFQTNFGNYTTTVNNEVSAIGNVVTGIANDKNNLLNDRMSLETASETLAELVAGPTQVQLLSQQINVKSAQNTLETAQENLADTSIRAPIDGIVASIGAVVGETVASPAVTIVGDGEVAQVTLNEVDAAKVVNGDKATLTFDAIDGLSLAGTVGEIDPVGTVSQGVVNYNVKVAFSEATSTHQVKPGMSVTASIVTDVHQDVIVVPNAAVIKQGTASYVQVPVASITPAEIAASAQSGIELPAGVRRVPVTTGLSDDTNTEIVSGINEGDVIIAKTTTGALAASSAATTNGLRLGGGLFGGGAVRVGGGGATGR